jgi:DNA-binding MarR family transcriptional regulator
LGLTLAQYTALSVLSTRPGLTNAQLARRSLITPQGMNPALAVLADKGLIRRKRARHGRELAIHLTTKGKKLLERCNAATEAVEKEMLGRLSAEDLERFVSYLQVLTDVGGPPPTEGDGPAQGVEAAEGDGATEGHEGATISG